MCVLNSWPWGMAARKYLDFSWTFILSTQVGGCESGYWECRRFGLFSGLSIWDGTLGWACDGFILLFPNVIHIKAFECQGVCFLSMRYLEQDTHKWLCSSGVIILYCNLQATVRARGEKSLWWHSNNRKQVSRDVEHVFLLLKIHMPWSLPGILFYKAYGLADKMISDLETWTDNFGDK